MRMADYLCGTCMSASLLAMCATGPLPCGLCPRIGVGMSDVLMASFAIPVLPSTVLTSDTDHHVGCKSCVMYTVIDRLCEPLSLQSLRVPCQRLSITLL